MYVRLDFIVLRTVVLATHRLQLVGVITTTLTQWVTMLFREFFRLTAITTALAVRVNEHTSVAVLF